MVEKGPASPLTNNEKVVIIDLKKFRKALKSEKYASTLKDWNESSRGCISWLKFLNDPRSVTEADMKNNKVGEAKEKILFC